MKPIFYIVPVLIALAFVLHSFSGKETPTTGQPADPRLTFKIGTTAFAPEADMPVNYTCDGANTSPMISWQGEPAGTKSFALIAEDPDAPTGTVIHWVVYDIPATMHELPNVLPDGVHQGKNTMGKNAYSGPCPPPGKPHRYYFKLYALDKVPGLPPETTDSDALKKAMLEHVLLTDEMMGRYQRK